MDLSIFPERFREGIETLAREFSVEQPELFQDSILQGAADMLVWTPDELPPDVSEKLVWVAQKTGRFLFLSLPYENTAQTEEWARILEMELSLREWLVLDHREKRLICTARRMQDWRVGMVVGATDYETRRKQIKHNIDTYPMRVKVPREEHNTPLILVCYGPSIHETWRTAVAEAKALGGHIATNSGAHDFLIKKGVIPHYHVEIDPRQERANFTEQPNPHVSYLIASVCHADLTAKLAPYDMALYHLNDGPESREIFEYEPDAVLTDGGSCVALRSLSLFYQMGYRYFSIYGFDCSFKNDMQWAGPHPGKKHKVQEVQIVGGPDKLFKTSAALLTYGTQFFEHVNMLPDAKFFLHGDGLLQEWAKTNAKMAREAQTAAPLAANRS